MQKKKEIFVKLAYSIKTYFDQQFFLQIFSQVFWEIA